MLSDLARRALTEATPAPAAEPEQFYGFRPLPADGRIVTDETVEALRDDLGT